MLKGHQEILKRLTGFRTEEELPADIWECGPYMLYGITEFQHQHKQNELQAVLPKVSLCLHRHGMHWMYGIFR